MQTKKWIETNSFHYKEFQDIDELVALKKKQNITISLGLPTKNVEETLEPILFTMRNYLQDQYPLIDEIAIIDARSTDRTVEIAKEQGASVFLRMKFYLRPAGKEAKAKLYGKA
jgi:glucosyl-3-phosphoglycerate synthase